MLIIVYYINLKVFIIIGIEYKNSLIEIYNFMKIKQKFEYKQIPTSKYYIHKS